MKVKVCIAPLKPVGNFHTVNKYRSWLLHKLRDEKNETVTRYMRIIADGMYEKGWIPDCPCENGYHAKVVKQLCNNYNRKRRSNV